MPIVSIIIPVYNDEKHIADAIESALAQTFKDVEVIVIDDGSTDGTPEVLEKYKDRVTIIRQQNRGVSAARNSGITASNGEYICFLDSDDLIPEDKVENQIEVLLTNPKADVCYGAWQEVDERTGGIIGPRLRRAQIHGNFVDYVALRKPFPQNAAVIRRLSVEQVGGYDEALSSAVDVDLWWKLAKQGCRFVETQRLVAIVRRRRDSLTRNPEARRKGRLGIIKKHLLCPGANSSPSLVNSEYAKAWYVAGADCIRFGRLRSAIRHCTKALEYDALVFQKFDTWMGMIPRTSPAYPHREPLSWNAQKEIARFMKSLIRRLQLDGTSDPGQKARTGSASAAMFLGLALFSLNRDRGFCSRYWLARSVLESLFSVLRPEHLKPIGRIMLGPVFGKALRAVRFPSQKIQD